MSVLSNVLQRDRINSMFNQRPKVQCCQTQRQAKLR